MTDENKTPATPETEKVLNSSLHGKLDPNHPWVFTGDGSLNASTVFHGLTWMKMHDDVIIPIKATSGASGYDIHAYVKEPVQIHAGERVMIPTGISVRIPDGFEIQVRPRSGLSCKHGLIIPNAPGTVDSDYQGEIMVCLLNTNGGDNIFAVEPGMRIAQLVLAPVATMAERVMDYEAPTSERGTGGFGSTGLSKL